jgi:uncharacterized protein involved in outer membrane biogenesis
MLWAMLALTVVLLLLVLALNLPVVQRPLARYLSQMFSERLDSRVEIASLGLRLPRALVLEGLFIADQQQDTLLYGGRLAASFDLRGLFSRRLKINSVSLEGVDIRLLEGADGLMNYQFVIDAFSPKPNGEVALKERLNAPTWSILITDGTLSLRDVGLRYFMPTDGIDLDARLGKVEFTIEEADVLQYRYTLKKAMVEQSRIVLKLSLIHI